MIYYHIIPSYPLFNKLLYYLLYHNGVEQYIDGLVKYQCCVLSIID